MISLSRNTLFILILSLLCHTAWSGTRSTIVTVTNKTSGKLNCGSGNTNTHNDAEVSTASGSRSNLLAKDSVKIKFKGKFSDSYASVKCKNGNGDTVMKLTVYIPGTDKHHHHIAAKQAADGLGLIRAKSGSDSTFDYTAEGRSSHSVSPTGGKDISNDEGVTITIK